MQQLSLFPPQPPRDHAGRFAPIYRATIAKMTRRLKRDVRRMELAAGIVVVHRHVRHLNAH